VTDVPVAGAVSKEVKWVNDHGQPVTFVNDNGEPVKWTTNAPQRASVQPPQEPVLKDQTFGVGEANGTADVSGAAGTVSRAAGNADGTATSVAGAGASTASGSFYADGVGAVTFEGTSARRPAKSRRMRTAVGRSVQANNATIILSVASLLPLIDEKLASLRDERPNDPDAKASRNEAIKRYEIIKRDIEALRIIAFDIRRGKAEEKTVAKVTTNFAQGICNWWEKGHDQICSKAFDASLFVSCVSLCALAGCGGRPPLSSQVRWSAVSR
jgi:hypothetical protein